MNIKIEFPHSNENSSYNHRYGAPSCGILNVFLLPRKHATFKSTRDKHRKLHTGCLPRINIITGNKGGPKTGLPGRFSFEQQNLVANFPLRYRIVLGGRELVEGCPRERGRGRENHRETQCPARPARTMGILYGHMLPKRGQLFMTPFRERPTVRCWSSIVHLSIGYRLSILLSRFGDRGK